jgi:2,3-bisphosphoglycerate-dependent phosphoglycerate mutase
VIHDRTSITVVRHGETEWNKIGLHQGVLDSPLTEKGIEQAENVVWALQKYTFQKLYSSDLGRAVQTAKIFAAALKLDIIYDSRLQERNLGCLGGLTLDEFKKQYPDDCERFLAKDPEFILPGGESIRQAYERSMACFEELAAKHQNESILIVTHGFILEYLFRRTLEIPLDQPRRFALKNCSINRFLKRSDGWKLDIWGEICS